MTFELIMKDIHIEYAINGSITSQFTSLNWAVDESRTVYVAWLKQYAYFI